MLDRFFRLSENGTTVRTELLAGLTTFLTMAYIIVIQPAVLSGRQFGMDTGMDFGAVMTATCIAAVIATVIMALYARYPIAQAPGMGENFFFVLCTLPIAAGAIGGQVAPGWLAGRPMAVPLIGDFLVTHNVLAAGSTSPWQVGLGVIFYSGLLFLVLSLFGVREAILDSISPSMRDGIAAGIGVFIAFIGLKGAGLIVADPLGTFVKMNTQFASPDLGVFFFGLLVTAVLYARRVRGAIVLGMLAATLLAVVLLYGLSRSPGAMAKATVEKSDLITKFAAKAEAVRSGGPVSLPPSVGPTLLRMDPVCSLSWTMAPFIFIFLFMVLFDTLGTLIGVTEQAGLIKDNKLPRAKQALVSDAVGTVAGAALGTSTVTSFIESAAGVEQGGRTGLTSLCTAGLFLVALFFSPLAALLGSYPAITAPALVVVGSMMMRNVTKVDWSNYAEAMPSFLVIIGIPLTFSIADGLALGFIAYPIVKLCAGQGRDVKWLMYVMALVLVAYFVFVRMPAGA